MPTRAQEQAQLAKAQAQRETRRAELDVMQQLQAQYASEQAQRRQAEEQELQAMLTRRERIASGQEPLPAAIPSIQGIYEAKATERQAAEQEAERQRIASLTPRDIWLSTRSLSERNSIARWEQINGMPYPIPGEVVEV